jgi:hypothetical protein
LNLCKFNRDKTKKCTQSLRSKPIHFKENFNFKNDSNSIEEILYSTSSKTQPCLQQTIKFASTSQLTVCRMCPTSNFGKECAILPFIEVKKELSIWQKNSSFFYLWKKWIFKRNWFKRLDRKRNYCWKVICNSLFSKNGSHF